MKFGKIIAVIGILISALFIIVAFHSSEHLVITLMEDGKTMGESINSLIEFVIFFIIMLLGAITTLMVSDKPRVIVKILNEHTKVWSEEEIEAKIVSRR